MRDRLIVAVVLLLAGCGGGNPNSPSPQPSPAPPPTFSGTVTNTVSGAPVLGFSATILAGRLTVSAPGYLTRETSAGRATVDLIPEAGFDLGFYRQFARGALEDSIQPLRVLSAAPSVYMQTAGLKVSTVSAYEQAARATVIALTGGRFDVVTWQTGDEARPPIAGWITVHLVNDEATNCGRALIGGSAGHVWINTAAKCHRNGDIVGTSNVMAHEVGHALGFFHVDRPGSLMTATTTTGTPSDLERHHAAIAYARTAGNRDLDVDP